MRDRTFTSGGSQPDGSAPSDPDVQYIFVFSPNNSGTTALCQFIQAQSGGYLPPFGNNEGQMVPEVKQMMRTKPWDPDREMNWPEIKKAWDSRCVASEADLFIEGSPPNMIRWRSIRRTFDRCSRYLAFISSPYMQVASCAYNYGSPAELDLDKLTRAWISKAECIADIYRSNTDIPLITYEEFCKTPKRVNDLLGMDFRDEYQIQGKLNSNVQKIEDRSAQTISFLTESEISRISATLADHSDLASSFGYEVMSGSEMFQKMNPDNQRVAAGLERRRVWEEAGGRPDKVEKRAKAKR